MKTIVYIDGFNLYYSALFGSPYKWLNLEALLAAKYPQLEIEAIKYYSARVKALPHDPDQPKRQQIYWKALETLPKIQILEGYYRTDRRQRWRANPPREKVWVYETLEKGSDVNLATDFVNDAYQNRYELGVILSDDSDLANALRVVKRDAGKIVGVLSPTMDGRGQELRSMAHHRWRHHLDEQDLLLAQFPKTIHREGKSSLTKPALW